MGYALKQTDATPAAGYDYADALREYLDANKAKGITQREVARRLEYSPTAISQYLLRKYDGGDLTRLNSVIKTYLDAEQQYQTFRPDVRDLADTAQYDQILGTIHYIEQNKLFGLIVGEAGIGKSAAFREYARTHIQNVILLTLDPMKKSKSAFIQHFWGNLPGNAHKRLSSSLMADEIISYLNNKHKTILVDEAQFLSMDALEMARSIQDKTGIGFVLGGTFNLDRDFGLNGHKIVNEQLHSRVLIYTRLNPQIKKADIAKVLGLYGVADPDVTEWFVKRANRVGRRYRWICALLKAAYGLSVATGRPLNIDMIEEAEGLTGLY